MTDTNLSFLARQLVLTELQGKLTPALPGAGSLCSICCGKLWAGVYHLAVLPEAEQYIHSVQELARQSGVPIGGFISLVAPEEEAAPKLIQLREALYVYGFPAQSGIGQGGPDTVQVLAKPPANTAQYEIESINLEEAGAAELAEQAGEADDRLDSPAWEDEEAMLSHSHFFIARHHGQPAGLAGITEGELAARVSVYWVAPQYRGAGVGRELISHLAVYWAAQGKLILSTWTHREGHLRYYFNKLGFEDRLRAIYFLPEDQG